jgi:hypothetical protein
MLSGRAARKSAEISSPTSVVEDDRVVAISSLGLEEELRGLVNIKFDCVSVEFPLGLVVGRPRLFTARDFVGVTAVLLDLEEGRGREDFEGSCCLLGAC